MIDETYAAFSGWDLGESKKANLDRLRSENTIGASSATWLRDVAKVLNRRFEPDDRDLALVLLAQAGFPLDEWKPLMLWHMTRDEFLVADFLEHWLFDQWEEGAYRIRHDELTDYVRNISARGGKTEHEWTDSTVDRVTAGLLKLATDFGLMRGKATKEFANYRLPERSFIYLLYAIRDERRNAARTISADDWRMYLMTPTDVEQELLRLHQFKKLHYQSAGSIVELDLPLRERPASTPRSWRHEHQRPDEDAAHEGSRADPLDARPAAQDQRLPRHALRALPLLPAR